jgi:hypothetical protein
LRSFEIYVFDDRYSVPTLHFVSAKDEARTRDIARRILGESDHHLGVEVSEEGCALFLIGSREARQPAQEPMADAP